ncbi:MAG TPA: HAMP domain-containing histidine kinase [Tissierellia bacterium]|nr:HAMP domain-containing histidine kinase [Tissierellia bacterium]
MKSIRSKMFWTFSAVVIGILVLSVGLNSLLFKPYSIAQDKQMFRELESQVREQAQTGVITTDLLSDLSAAYGVQLDVVDRITGDVIYSSSGIGQMGGGANRSGRGRMQGYRTSYDQMDLSSDAVMGFRQPKTTRGEDVLMLISPLDPSTALVVYRPVSMIDRSVSQANRFVWLVGLLLLALGGLIIYWLAGRQVKPILALHKQTDRMAELDFSDRFLPSGQDEINRLGENINAISDKLSQTIGTLESDVQKLTEVDKVRKHFIASVSHEFKSPLGLIKGYTEALKYSLVSPEEEDRYYDTIIGETDRMDQLVQDLILLMKRELDQDPMKPEPVEVCSFLEMVLARHQAIQPNRHYLVTCQPVTVWADEAGLTRVMDNFLQNAYTYGAENSPIDLAVEETKDFITLTISNDGPRIPEDQRQAIWESFHKIDPARRDRGEGTGLGLAINKAIIEAHGGQVGVNNTATGVAFYFRLPLSQAEGL